MSPVSLSLLSLLGAVPATALAEDPLFQPLGWVETQLSLHVDDPERRVTDYRLNDDRALTINLSGVALGGVFLAGPVDARVVLQLGRGQVQTFAGEPTTGAAVGNDPDFWELIQEGHLGFRAGDVELRAGLFLSPIGAEVAPVHGNWSWSRSNLYYALPAYHTGARVNLGVDGWTLTAAVYDGWSSSLDRNDEKSIALSAAFALGELSGQVLYFGGVERSSADPEGLAWRHLLDAYLSLDLGGPALMLHVDVGWEPNDLDTNRWLAAAAYVRLPLVEDALRLALRADVFSEKHGAASPIAFPAPWVASGTATLDWHALPHLRVMLEYRHDQAGRAMYQGGTAQAQNTLTLGATSFF